jgi:PBP1b-binding outer membrane lipoprotein LpoB
MCRISTPVIILVCALSLSGCDRGPKTQKAQTAPSPPVASVAPVTPTAPTVPPAPMAPTATKTPSAPDVKKYVGKYLNKKYPKDFTELKSDGTFLYREGKINLTGKYSIQGNRLLLALPDGSGSISNIDDRGMTDNAGELWTKQ